MNRNAPSSQSFKSSHLNSVNSSYCKYLFNFSTFCHGTPIEGHFGPQQTTKRVLDCGFYWPDIFRDAHLFPPLVSNVREWKGSLHIGMRCPNCSLFETGKRYEILLSWMRWDNGYLHLGWERQWNVIVWIWVHGSFEEFEVHTYSGNQRVESSNFENLWVVL